MDKEEGGQSAPEGETGNWKFHAEGGSPAPATSPLPTNLKPITWTASEFIQHDKSAGWYFGLGVSGVVLAALVYLLTKDKISTGMIVVVAVIFGIFAARRPRELKYQLDSTGLRIGDKTYPYGNFKSFSVVSEGAVESIWLMPLKRFMPIITIYFAPQDGDKITGMLANFLPFQEHQLDPVDKLMHRLRF